MSVSVSKGSASKSAVVRVTHGVPRWAFFAVFTVSGFSGLIYESIWSHYLKLFLGHAAYAQSLVLMIFMGGMAAGSWIAARFADRWRTPILYYAIVEAVIGLIALTFHKAFVGMSDAFYFSILPSVGSAAVGGLLKWSAASALILPQSVLLGMTFPLLSAGILRRYPDQPGGSLAMLYFTNSIGAAIGVLISGFWLINAVGLPGTILTAGLLNVALALVVWALVKVDAGSGPVVRAVSSATLDDSLQVSTLFFFAAGVTGAASFIYEIGWIRMLSLVLGATTHSFELMLSAFITGLAFGGLWMKRRIDRIANPIRFAGWIQVLMGVLAALTIPLYVRTFDWMAAVLAGLEHNDSGYHLFTGFSHAVALLVMVPTTFLAGMTLPLFTKVLLRAKHGESAIGKVYAANTLGSILGVLFAVHIGMPLLGLKSLIVFGAALDVALGVLLLYRSCARSDAAVVVVLRGALFGGIALAAVAFTVHLDPHRLASGVYRYRWSQLDDHNKVLYYKDGKTASVSLFATGSSITISTNGKPDASIEMNPAAKRTTDEITMIMAAALPLAYAPHAREIANIGLGSGLTTHTLLADDAIESIDTIEIEPAMIEAARGFGDRVARTFSDPRSHIRVEDAKTFFSLQQKRYDAIVAEPSNPWVSGVSSLFSEEFYRTVPRYLKPDGVFVQWLQLYEFNDQLAQSVLKALSATFADVAIYNTDDNDVLIVAKANGSLGQPDFNRLLRGALGTELAAVGLRNPADFIVRKSASRPILDAVLTQSPIPTNSDYFPFLDLNAGRARFAQQTAGMFRSWGVSSLPLLEMVGLNGGDYANVSVEDTFRRTIMIQQAKAQFMSLTTEGTHARASPLGAAATIVELLRRSCEPLKQEELWLLALNTVAQATLPFLQSSDATAMLDATLPADCVASASSRLKTWMALYRAVAGRDAAAMVDYGVAALREPPLDTSLQTYALSAAMLGALASHRPDLALELWRQRPDPLQTVSASPDIELVIRLAETRVAEGLTLSERRAE
jgi:spermidine synthase